MQQAVKILSEQEEKGVPERNHGIMIDPLMSDSLFIYSSLPLMQHFLEEDARRSSGFILGYRHVLFSDFIGLILSSREKITGSLTSLGEYRLLKETVEREWREDEPFLGAILKFRGSLELLLSMIHTLREAHLTCDNLRSALARMGEEREKFEIIIKIMEGYEGELEKLNLCDGPAGKIIAMERLADEKSIDDLDMKREIHFNWIYRISELDFQIICALCRRALRRSPESPQQVFFHLPYDAYRQDAFRFLNPLVERFESLADDLPNLTLDFAPLSEETTVASTVSYLHRHLFKAPQELMKVDKTKNDGSVQLIKAPGYQAEIDEICREIRLLLRDGVKCADIIVTFRSLSQYGPMLFEASQKFSLPFSFPRGNPLLSSHMVRTLLLPFTILQSAYAAEDVMKLLNSLYIDYSMLLEEGQPPLPPGLIHELVRKAGIIDDATAAWEPALYKYMTFLSRDQEGNEEGPSDLLAGSRSLLGVIRKLKASLSRLRGPSTVRRFSSVLKSLIREFRIRENIIKKPQGFEGSHWPLLSLQRDLSALEGFEKSLRTLERTAHALGISGSVTMEEFYDMLLEELKGRNLSPPGDRGGIRVLDAFDLLGHRTPYLFLGGLSEGQFPTRHYEHVLFSDEEKTKFNDIFQKKLFISTPLRHWEENFLFSMALHSCRHKACLSFSNLDERGEAQIPSYFLNNYISLLDENPLDSPSSASLRAQPYLHEPALIVRPQELDGYLALSLWRERPRHQKDLAMELLRCLQNSRYGEYRAHLASIFKRCETEKLREDYLLNNLSGPGGTLWGAIEAPDLKTQLRDRYGSGKYLWSASALEDYGRCPFIFFAKRILRIEPPITPELEIDRLTEGTIIHEVLEHFFLTMGSRGKLPLAGLASEHEELGEIAAQVFKGWEEKKATGDMHFWELKKRSILRTLHRWIDYEHGEGSGHFIPAFFEAQFGRDSVPFSFPGADGTMLHFTGKIDRIDLRSDGAAFRVVDYKNSRIAAEYKRKLDPSKLGTINFQIPLYAMAAEDILRTKGAMTDPEPGRHSGYAVLKKPAMVLQDFRDASLVHYFSTDPGVQQGLQDHERNFPRQTSELLERLMAGNLQPRGLECDYCDYGEFCRFKAEGTEDDE
jgi:ATP-dependent helicase/DNAse subunit B